MATIKDLKAVCDKGAYHKFWVGSSNDFVIKHGDDIIMTVHRSRDQFGQWFTSDKVAKTFKTMKEVKEYCLTLIEARS